MNYKESKKILSEIKKTEKILVNCHRVPDADSIGSAQAMRKVLEKMGKEVSVICPTSIPGNLEFLALYGEIRRVNFEKFDFSEYELFITLDSANWKQVSSDAIAEPPDIKIVNIDHHITNSKYGFLNLIEDGATSTAEIIYKIFKDWGVKIDKVTASALLAGIIGDTGSFRFPGVGREVFEIAADLMKYTDKDIIIKNLYQNYDLDQIKLWAEIIGRIEVDEKHKFAWSAVPADVFKSHNKPAGAKSDVAEIIFQSIKGTKFGIVMVEEQVGKLSISLRARGDFDVSKIAEVLGGGGHKAAAGARIEGMKFEKSVEKVLRTAKKFAKIDE